MSPLSPIHPQRSTARSRKLYTRLAVLLLCVGAYGLYTSGQYTASPPQQLTRLEYGNDGLVRRVQLESNGSIAVAEPNRKREEVEVMNLEEHPIFELVAKGQKDWTDLLARQSRTLPQAVMEYQNRYKRKPPKGFEQWWHFCRRNNVKIVDDYDQIYRDVQPFFALSPALFRKRAEALTETPTTFAIHLSPNSASYIDGNQKHIRRAIMLFELLEPIAQYLPTNVTIHHSNHDIGSWLLGDDQRQAALNAVEHRRHLTEEDLQPYEVKEGRSNVKGLASACPKGSPAWQRALALQSGQEWIRPLTETGISEGEAFLHDPTANSDFCYITSHLEQHGQLSYNFARDTTLRPIFQLSKFVRNAEFLSIPMMAYDNATSSSAIKNYLPWEKKTIDRLFWRGTTTGDLFDKRKGNDKDYDWRKTHRIRLGLMAQQDEGEKKVWVQRGTKWVKEAWGMGDLNDYLDVGFTDGPQHCSQKDGTCDDMREEIKFVDRVEPSEAAKYKYMLDMDGNGWSSRFHRLMSSGSVVLKSTILPEWYSDWLTPWYHYIPVQIDYSDLYPIMSFLLGPPDQLHLNHPAPPSSNSPNSNADSPKPKQKNKSKLSGHVGSGSSEFGGHDEIAQKISENAKKFVDEHWRWVDMQAYMFRLVLEYARLEADDREAWSYSRSY